MAYVLPTNRVSSFLGASPSGPTMQLKGIHPGERGTVQTLEAMRAAALGEDKFKEGAHNKDVRLLAQKIVAGVGNKDYVGEMRAVWDFVKANVRYTLDPRGLEWVQTPRYTLLVMGQGDCDDHATAIAGLAVALGHGAAFRTVKGDRGRPNDWTHVYAVVGVRQPKRGTVWLPMDTTEKNARFGQDPPGVEKAFGKRTWVIVPA